MKPINICFILDIQGKIGGTERVAADIINNISSEKIKASVLIFDKIRQTHKINKPIYQIEKKDTIEYIKKENISAVISFGYRTFTYDEIKNIKKFTKYLQLVNFTVKYDPNADMNLITTKYDYCKIKILNKNIIKNSTVLYHPVDLKKWKNNSENIKIKPYFKSDNIIVGRIARNEPSKWNYLLLATMMEIKKRGCINKFKFIFLGMPKPYKIFLKIFFRKEIKTNRILFLAESSDDEKLSKVYKTLDVFYQTSWIGESFGCVIAESFAHKKPVMADFNKSIKINNKINEKLYDAQSELVDHKVNGYVTSNPQSAANYLINTNKETLTKMGENGYEKALNRYEVNTITTNLENILENLVLNKNNKIYPLKEEIDEYLHEYKKKLKRINLEEEENGIIKKYKFFIESKIFRGFEYSYLIWRKLNEKT